MNSNDPRFPDIVEPYARKPKGKLTSVQVSFDENGDFVSFGGTDEEGQVFLAWLMASQRAYMRREEDFEMVRWELDALEDGEEVGW